MEGMAETAQLSGGIIGKGCGKNGKKEICLWPLQRVLQMGKIHWCARGLERIKGGFAALCGYGPKGDSRFSVIESSHSPHSFKD